MPHVRQLEMKVIIEKSFSEDKPWEIKEFIRTTKNFSKKFYKVRYIHLEADVPVIQYHAIAISRDMIYDAWAVFSCYPQKSFKPEEIDGWLKPPHGLLPLDENCRDYLYPRLFDDDDLLRHINIFEYNDFMLVQEIEYEVPRKSIFQHS